MYVLRWKNLSIHSSYWKFSFSFLFLFHHLIHGKFIRSKNRRNWILGWRFRKFAHTSTTTIHIHTHTQNLIRKSEHKTSVTSEYMHVFRHVHLNLFDKYRNSHTRWLSHSEIVLSASQRDAQIIYELKTVKTAIGQYIVRYLWGGYFNSNHFIRSQSKRTNPEEKNVG